MPTDYQLREGLSYCRIDGQVIFLDLQRDRYFRLAEPVETAFTAFVEGESLSESELESLTRNNILSTTCRQGHEPGRAVPQPTYSAAEQFRRDGPAHPAIVLEVSVWILMTWWMLRAHKLAEVIDRFVSYRRKHAGSPISAAAASGICEAALVFQQARLYVPIQTSCLLDSLALARFLARRRIRADLVFGITRVPFAAHCWVQFGGIVLNDTLGSVTSHTPIRVV